MKKNKSITLKKTILSIFLVLILIVIFLLGYFTAWAEDSRVDISKIDQGYYKSEIYHTEKLNFETIAEAVLKDIGYQEEFKIITKISKQ